jgi:exoribonuclease R
VTTPHDFEAIRVQLDLPSAANTDEFPADVEAEAATIAAVKPTGVETLDLPFVTIDPPGSKDLDQAMFLERVGDGFRVHYAIVDLGSSIPAGGPVDTEARRRGQTVYLPDGRVPLHPTVLSEGALSLLPDQLRRAAVWTIDVDADGKTGTTSVKRALATSVAQFDYEAVQATFDAGKPHPSIEPLADLGKLRLALRVGLGAIELALPEQEVVRDGDDWRVHMRKRTDVDAWNAEISLLTGMAAAELMINAKIGLLRTLPRPDGGAVKTFLRTARSLGIDVPEGATPATILAALDPDQPTAMALMTDATKLLRGAGYTTFDGGGPNETSHAGIGGPYAHVTAPLRRLADRFGTEICLAICNSQPVPEWVREALPALPEIMSTSDHETAKADRSCIDAAEAWMLEGHIGESFDAVVLHVDDRGAEVMVIKPPVIARCKGAGLHEGAQVAVRLDAIDVISFSYVGATTE